MTAGDHGAPSVQPVVPLRPLGAAELLDAAVRIVRRNARAAFGVAVPLAAVQALLRALITLATYDSAGATQAQEFGGLFVVAALSAVVTGALAPVVMGDVMGHRLSLRQALRAARGVRGFALLVVLGIVLSLGETLALVTVVGGLWLWGSWAVAAPVMVLERLGPIAALRRSFRLVRREFWRTWGVRALGWVLTTVLGLLITLPIAVLAAAVGSIGFEQSTGDISHAGLFVTIIAIGQLLAVSLTSPITAAIDGLLYTDLRMRVEGMDIQLNLPRPAAQHEPRPVSAW